MAHARADFVRFISRQHMYFLEEDWRALTHRIAEMFPEVKFFAQSEEYRREENAIEKELKSRGDRRPVDSRHSLYARALSNFERTECAGLYAHSYSHWTYAVINAGRWKPVWEVSGGTFAMVMKNLPDESFSFYVSKIYRSLISDPLAAEPLPSLKDNEVLCLGESSFNGTYAPGDDRMKKLLQRVARAIDKMTDNRYVALEPADWSVRLTIEKGGVMHIAPDAKRWAMAHPRHLLGPNLAKPIEWRDRATAASAS